MKQRKLLLVGILMLSVLVFAGCDSFRLARYIGPYTGTFKLKLKDVDHAGTWQFTVNKGGSFTGKCLIKGITQVHDITGSVNPDGSFTGSWEMNTGSTSTAISFTGKIVNKTVTGEIKIGPLSIGNLEGKKVSVLEQLLP